MSLGPVGSGCYNDFPARFQGDNRVKPDKRSMQHPKHYHHSPIKKPGSGGIQFLKGHTLSLESHYAGTANRIHPRSKMLLVNRGSSYPALAYDVSAEIVEETIKRRSIHGDLLKETYGNIFRKKKEKESTSDFFDQRHTVRDYLLDIHPDYDPADVTGKVYSVSRLKLLSRDNNNNNNNNNSADDRPLEDFIRPTEVTRPRSTGYSPGHVRTMLGLDAYGPNSSINQNNEREMGELPVSPNTDRYKVLNKPSTAPSASFRPKTSNKKEFENVDSNLFQVESDHRPKTALVKTNKFLTEEDRSLKDPNTKSVRWYEEYRAKIQNKKQNYIIKQQILNYQQQQKMEADNVMRELNEFEQSLKLKTRRSTTV